MVLANLGLCRTTKQNFHQSHSTNKQTDPKAKPTAFSGSASFKEVGKSADIVHFQRVLKRNLILSLIFLKLASNSALVDHNFLTIKDFMTTLQQKKN